MIQMVSSPSGRGALVLDDQGNVFALGDARSLGSLSDAHRSTFEPGERVRTPVSLVDGYQTILENAGIDPDDEHAPVDGLPGIAWQKIVKGVASSRMVLSEYHAVGSITAIFMLRWRRYKYVHYEGYRPQLFDLEADPLETRDLALEPEFAALVKEGERNLRAVCDVEEVTARAFADQAARIAEFGGEQAVLEMGSYPYTPAPGEAPRISGAGPK